MTILIIGGGIGGLTTALSLHQIGIPCRVYESVAKPQPLGVGINLLPHAVRELTELGLREEIAANAIPTSELVYYSKHGQRIWAEPRGIDAGYNWPQFSIHRGELQMILLRAARQRLGPDNVQTSHHLMSWDDTGTGVRARFADGSVADGALMIASDGIHSAVRRALYPTEGAPVWKGVILWRGTTRARPFLTGRSMVMVGHEFQKFVAYPIAPADPDSNAGLINWIAERKFPPDQVWKREDWNRAGALADFLPQFDGWRFDWLDIPALVRGAERCFEYPMVDRDPLQRWSFGRVTLLGDAAHPMYPIGSNGSSQAILDARVLAREIHRLGPVPEALAAYEAERRPATTRIVLANRGNGPDQIMELVEQRAPDGFDRIGDVLDAAELAEIAAGYKKVAGFDREGLNARPPIVNTDQVYRSAPAFPAQSPAPHLSE